MHPKGRLAGWTLALAAAVAAPSALPAAADDAGAIEKFSHVIAVSDDPIERAEAVRGLGKCRGPNVARRLGLLALEDEDPGLRIAAAEALGAVDDDGASEVLLQVAQQGGVRGLRRAVGVALERRGVGADRIAWEATHAGRDTLCPPLLLATLSERADSMGAAHLQLLAETARGAVRTAALRALSAHALGKKLLPDALFAALGDAVGLSRAALGGVGTTRASGDPPDLDTVLEILDLAEDFGDRRIRSFAGALGAIGSPKVDWAFRSAVGRIEWRERGPLAADATADDLDPPPKRRRADRVVVFHRNADLELMRSYCFAALDAPEGTDARASVVAYRERTSDGKPSSSLVLPFTRDRSKISGFFRDLTGQTGTAKGRGQASALEEALDRASWRWNADRSLTLLADADPDSNRRARRDVSSHFAADGTRTDVVWVGRDAKVPPDLTRLAKEGGGRVIDPAAPALDAGGSGADAKRGKKDDGSGGGAGPAKK